MNPSAKLEKISAFGHSGHLRQTQIDEDNKKKNFAEMVIAKNMSKTKVGDDVPAETSGFDQYQRGLCALNVLGSRDLMEETASENEKKELIDIVYGSIVALVDIKSDDLASKTVQKWKGELQDQEVRERLKKQNILDDMAQGMSKARRFLEENNIFAI